MCFCFRKLETLFLDYNDFKDGDSEHISQIIQVSLRSPSIQVFTLYQIMGHNLLRFYGMSCNGCLPFDKKGTTHICDPNNMHLIHHIG